MAATAQAETPSPSGVARSCRTEAVARQCRETAQNSSGCRTSSSGQMATGARSASDPTRAKPQATPHRPASRPLPSGRAGAAQTTAISCAARRLNTVPIRLSNIGHKDPLMIWSALHELSALQVAHFLSFLP